MGGPRGAHSAVAARVERRSPCGCAPSRGAKRRTSGSARRARIAERGHLQEALAEHPAADLAATRAALATARARHPRADGGRARAAHGDEPARDARTGHATSVRQSAGFAHSGMLAR
jgi:hypothetical protein